MAVSPTSKTLNVGETVQLTGTKNPTSASEGTQWTSSNTGVATVSGSGLVTAKAAGTATITFKNSSSTKSASCTITVLNKNIIVGDSLNGYLMKIDTNGNLVWYKYTQNLIRGGGVNISALCIAPDGNIMVGDSLNGYLMKINTNGNLVWYKYTQDLIRGGGVNISALCISKN